jgi:hypothetical protein
MGILERLRSKFYTNAGPGEDVPVELEAAGPAEEPPTGAELLDGASYDEPTKGPPPPRLPR